MQLLEQIQIFIGWFCQQGVNYFDIHVRKPKTRDADYKTGEWIWLTHHECVSFEYIKSKLLGWLRHQNLNGSDIFFRPHKDGKHNVIFLDDVPTTKAKMILKKYGSCVIETHPGNTQVWLKVDNPLDSGQRKQAQILIKDLGYTDPGSVAGDHLGRLCGLKSQKRKCWVNFIGKSNLIPWMPDLQSKPSLPLGVFCASKNAGLYSKDASNSGREWGWVMGMLRNGVNQEIVFQKLKNTAERRGKKNAIKYATYTVNKAMLKIDKITN